MLILHHDGRVIERAHKVATILKEKPQFAKIDIDANRPRYAVKVRAVDEENGSFGGVEIHFHDLS